VQGSDHAIKPVPMTTLTGGILHTALRLTRTLGCVAVALDSFKFVAGEAFIAARHE
jgi:hypothetical protein